MEVLCGIGVGIVVVALVVALIAFMLDLMWQGDDANAMNTATSLVHVESLGTCIVPGCSGSGAEHDAKHLLSDGTNIAYFDKIGNCLTGNKPAGYNEADVAMTGENTRTHKANTMVIQVSWKGMDYVAEWVPGAVGDQLRDWDEWHDQTTGKATE
ncbi:MAG: hypothetical protein Q4E12_04560 [Coriobacteriia bacterium]|nr:hypothetical protein [Coriobacteriia bacterium]